MLFQCCGVYGIQTEVAQKDLEERCESNSEATVCSKILARNGRLEMGRKLFRLSKSTLLVFDTGVTAAILSGVGTTPVHKESLIIPKTTGHSESKHDLNRQNGTGSALEVVAFIFKTTLQRDCESWIAKLEREISENAEIVKEEAAEVWVLIMWLRIL